MQINEKLVDGLIQIGFQQYQAQAYIASVILGDATAYQIAKESGVPRAKVYSVLDDLVKMGYLVKIPVKKGTLFRALSPEKTFGKTIQEFISNLEKVKKELIKLEDSKEFRSTETPVMIFNNVTYILDIISEGQFFEAWISEELNFANEVKILLEKQKCKIYNLQSRNILMLIMSAKEAYIITNGANEPIMIKIANKILPQILQIIEKTRGKKDLTPITDESIRILREAPIDNPEDRLKTIITGFDAENEPVLFWGRVEAVSGVFNCSKSCDCFITDSRIIFGSFDGRIFARSLNFINNVKLATNKVLVTFSSIHREEQLAISSSSYSIIINNLLKKYH
ncbi:MAG: hypothetical protein GF308_06380 [Candidatus Heimdallarchaeota archaeon]|nr:hypothetical protein [Candidatus Heimdallarchaeota archaeon]